MHSILPIKYATFECIEIERMWWIHLATINRPRRKNVSWNFFVLHIFVLCFIKLMSLMTFDITNILEGLSATNLDTSINSINFTSINTIFRKLYWSCIWDRLFIPKLFDYLLLIVFNRKLKGKIVFIDKSLLVNRENNLKHKFELPPC